MLRLCGVALVLLGAGACKRAPPGLAEQFAKENGCAVSAVAVRHLDGDRWDVSGCGSMAEYDCASGACVVDVALFDPTGGERAAGAAFQPPSPPADASAGAGEAKQP